MATTKRKTPWEVYLRELDIANDLTKAAHELQKAASARLTEAQSKCPHKNIEDKGMFCKFCRDCGWDDL